MKTLKANKYSILNKIAKYSFVFVLFLLVVSPFAINAADPPTTGNVNITTKINNPLEKTITDIPTFIETILNAVLVIGVPVITLAIIYAGFLFVKAQGNSEELTKAKKALMFTLIGATLLLGSFVISKAIKGTVDQIKS